MPTPDYSARDKAVKHNVYASVRRRDGLSREQFANYWRDVHSTLCSRLPGLGFYVQQHFDREGGANLWPIADGVGRIDAVLDGSAELGFANTQDQAIFAEAGKILYEDEHNLFGEAIAYFLPTGSTTLVDREEDSQRNGPDHLHRVHVYMSRRAGTDAAQWLLDSSADLASLNAIQKWKLHLPVAYDNAHPAPPSPNVDHAVGPDRLHLAVAEVAFENARVAQDFFAGTAFKRVLAAQAKHVNAIGAYLVSGFYTFVRDGMATPAGIRGSRAAELIDTLGASNQLAPAVRERFVRASTL
jgi:EthD domain